MEDPPLSEGHGGGELHQPSFPDAGAGESNLREEKGHKTEVGGEAETKVETEEDPNQKQEIPTSQPGGRRPAPKGT